MTFNINTDANWANVVATVGALPGNQQVPFYVALIQYLCAQATTSITLNTAAMSTAISTAAFTAAHENVRNF